MRRSLWLCSIAFAILLPLHSAAEDLGAKKTATSLDSLKQAASDQRFRPHEAAAAASPVSPAPDWLKEVSPSFEVPAQVVEAVARQRWADAYKAWKDAPPDAKARPNEALLFAWICWRATQHEAASAAAKRLLELHERQELGAEFMLLEEAWMIAVEVAHAQEQWAPLVKLAGAHLKDGAITLPHAQGVYVERLSYLDALASTKLKDKDSRADAIAKLRALLKRYPKASVAPQATSALVELLLADKKHDEAAALIATSLTDHPLSSESGALLKALTNLLGGQDLSATTRAQLEASYTSRALSRLNALFNAHRSDEAVELGASLIKGRDPKDKVACEAALLTARSYTKLRKHADSVPWYEHVINHCKDASQQRSALYFGARGLWNANQPTKALVWFERVWREHSASSLADDALLYAARIHREANRLDQARTLLNQQLKAYPSGDMAADAHWLLLRELISKQDWRGVISLAQQTKDPNEHDLYTQGRLDYFTARAHEHLKDTKQAQLLYEKVALAYPLGYYALLSLHGLARLKLPAKELADAKDLCAIPKHSICKDLLKDLAKPDPPITIQDAIKRDPSFRRGMVLLNLGLHTQAERELRRLRAKLSKDPASQWALAALLNATKTYPLSHDIPRREIQGWMTHYPHNKNRQRWEIAYPTPFRDEVERHAKDKGLPPAIVWAIMREESGFHPNVESWANARGLLQLMEKTGANIAQREGIKEFNKNDLFNYKINIQLGVAYMKELSGQLDDNPALIIAGYNGGYANVARWLKGAEGKLPLDLWVEDIPYGQTRNYTKRVLTSYWTYAWLYSDTPIPLISMTLPNPS